MDAVYTEDFEDKNNECESKFVVIENESDVNDGEAKKMPELSTDEVPPALAQYLVEIHSIPLLTVEEEVHYGRLALRGDKQAQDILVVHNLRLAATYALKIRNPDVPPEDMIQYANLGLVNLPTV